VRRFKSQPCGATKKSELRCESSFFKGSDKKREEGLDKQRAAPDLYLREGSQKGGGVGPGGVAQTGGRTENEGKAAFC